MRHLRKGKKLGRVAKQRKALMKTMSVSLVEHGRIKTTLTKAKALQPFIEKVITRAKVDEISSLRELRKLFPEKTAKILLRSWGPVFAERKGGYTRIIKLVARESDASPMAFIEFVEKPKEIEPKAKKEKKTEVKEKKELKKKKPVTSKVEEVKEEK